jgi:rhodanese-related sulfurtransferase
MHHIAKDVGITMTVTTPASTIPHDASLPPIVGPEQLDQFRRSGPAATIVDVRTPGEVEALHIPDSYNVPRDQVAEHGDEFHGVGEPNVLVCRSSMRARYAEALPRAADVPRLHVLDGEVLA